MVFNGFDLVPERTHYSKAPITEAVIDLWVPRAESFSVEDLAAIQNAVADRYPNRESEYMYTGQVYIEEAGDPAQTEGAQWHNGFRFASEDNQQVFYARLDGFAFTIKAPYDCWEPFRDEARRLWDLYRFATKAEKVTRVAVRYINRIDLPSTGTVHLEDYLKTYPEVSPSMPNEGVMANYFMQLQLWQEDLGCMLVVNESPEPSPTEEATSIRLDFDFFREQFEEPWQADEDEAVWEFLEKLHDRKNEVFEASITDETRRLIR